METNINSLNIPYLNEIKISNNTILCRLCGNTTSDFVQIFNNDGLKRNIGVKTESCLQIKVSIDDVLSTAVCISCCNLLDNYYEFFESTKKVQVHLQKLYKSSKNTIAINKQNEQRNCTEKNSINCLRDKYPAEEYPIEENSAEEYSPEEYLVEDKKCSSENKLKLKNISNCSKISNALKDYAWICTLCDFKNLESANDLQEHYKLIHNDELPVYKCIYCRRHYDKYRSFTKHILLHKNPGSFECDICGKSFNIKSTLMSHALVHTESRPYCCSICQKTFKCQATLFVHEKLHLSEETHKKFICQICQRECASKKTLENHIKMHAGTKNFMCDICGKTFVASSTLAYHLKSHSSERNHLCTTCGKGFRTERLLKKHSIVHSPSKRYCCTICKKEFRERSTLTSHARIHTGDMPYSCESCGKKFRFSGNMAVHRRTHTGEKPYSCLICKRAFNNKANFVKHKKRIHSNVKSSIDSSTSTITQPKEEPIEIIIPSNG